MENSGSKDYRNLVKMTNSQLYREFEKYYKNENLMDIIGVSRLENNHSNFLAWLLDENKSHKLGTYAIERLLETIMVAFTDSKFSTNENFEKNNFFGQEELQQSIRSLCFKIENVKVEREWTGWKANKGKQVSRLDIFIEADLIDLSNGEANNDKIIIAIENKVGSRENHYKNGMDGEKYQTEQYWKLLKEYVQGIDDKTFIIPVFLTPIPQNEYKEWLRNGKCEKTAVARSKQFFTLNYQYLLDGVLAPISTIIEDSHSKMLVEDYIRCLGRSTLLDESDSKEYAVLAISKNEKFFVMQLWKEHNVVLKKILKAAIEVENGETSEENYINYQNLYTNNKDFIQSIFHISALLFKSNGLLIENNEEMENLLDDYIKSLRKKAFFIFNGDVFESGKHKPKSIGWLAHELIKEWVVNNPDKVDMFVGELREVLNPSQKSNLWIGNVCVRRSEFETAQIEYLEKKTLDKCYKRDDLWCASRYFIDEEFISKSDIVPKRDLKEKDSISADKDNPICINNEKNDDLYVAHWWGESDIIKMLEIKSMKIFYKYDKKSGRIIRK